MKRIIKIMLVMLTLMVFNVYAAENTVTLTGKNTFGRELTVETTCSDTYKKPYSDSCNVKIRWYVNDTNSTTGGTEIHISDSENTFYSNYYIDREFVGNYIYVVATFVDYHGEAEDVTVADITDAETNGSAKVTDYILYDDTTNYTITTNAKLDVESSLVMQLNGITDTSSQTDYYLWFTDAGELEFEQTANIGCNFSDSDPRHINMPKYINKNTGVVSIDKDWFIMRGYTEAHIIKVSYDNANGGYYCTVTSQPVNIPRQDMPALGNRYKFYVFSQDKTISTFPLFPHDGENGSHTIVTKIGRINDNTLIKKLAKKQAGSLEELLDYAKNNTGTTFTYSDEHYYNNDIGSFNVINGAYYFIYTTYQNSDVLYRDLSDVTVVQGEAGMLVNDIDWPDYEDEEDVKWTAFVNHFKNSELLKGIADNVVITDTDNSLTAVYTDGDYSYSYALTYENGIISIEKGNEEGRDALMNSLFSSVTLKSFIKVYGYDENKALTYMESVENPTVSEHGFELEAQAFTFDHDTNTINIDINSKYVKKLKLDLRNGLKKYNEIDDGNGGNGNGGGQGGKENPKTGVAIPVIGGVTLIAVLGVVLTLKNKKRFY